MPGMWVQSAVCRQMWFWNVGNVGVAQPTAA